MTRIPDHGLAPPALFERLRAFRAADAAWADGRTFGHAFLDTEARRRVSEEACTLFLWENGLDPTMFPSLAALEREVVDMVAHHLGAPDAAQGTFTSGGTESVFLACLAARARFAHLHGDSARPRIVLPDSAHPCFHKSASYLGMAVDVVPAGDDLRADVDAMAAAITPATAMLVGSAPSYAHGVVDPIEALGALAAAHDLWLHVDGCIGGFLLPLWAALGETVPPWSLDVPGVTSVSVDLHKYAMCPKGASVVLFRDAAHRRLASFGFSDWPGYALINPTMQSSRSGGPLAAAWATLHHHGRDGYLAIAAQLRDTTRRLAQGLRDLGMTVVAEPSTTLLAFHDQGRVDVFALADALAARGWRLYPQFSHGGRPATLHLTVVPRNHGLEDRFLADVREALEAPPAEASAGMDPGMIALLGSLDDASLEALIGAMAPGEGGGGGGMADVNRLLDQLAPPVRDRILVVYDDLLKRR